MNLLKVVEFNNLEMYFLVILSKFKQNDTHAHTTPHTHSHA